MSEDHVARNRAHWERVAGEYQRDHSPQFSAEEPVWGAWATPEREVNALGEVAGLEVLELGCGAAYWSAALARRGAVVTALDLSPAQLAIARAAHPDAGFRLVEGNAEAMDFPAERFDLVFADHGAPTFCDPYRLLPEVARVLRPGGRFVFNMTTPLLDACWDGRRVGEQLATPFFAMHRFATRHEVSFQLSYGGWIGLFACTGFRIEDLIELRPPAVARTTFENFASPSWARRWPAEHIWKLRRT